MIPARSKRMTVAQLKERMDARFDSLSEKLDSIAKRIEEKLDGHFGVLGEREKRLRDLETWRKARDQ